MTAQKLITFLFLLLGFYTLQSQVGYTDQYYGARGNRMRQAQQNGKEVTPPTPEEIVDLQMPKLTEALGLDDFEQAVVYSILVKFARKHSELQILQLPKDKMREALEAIKESQQDELEAGLPPSKYQLLVDLQENGFKKQKNRKKKKKSQN